VTPAGEGGEDEPDLVALAVDDRLGVREEPLGDSHRALEPASGGLLFDLGRGHSGQS
jgi:hypothetical protein